MTDIRYFDFLFAELAKRNVAVEKSFGRHVHWGYWPDPAQATGEDDDYGQAAEALTLELCNLAGVADGDRVLDAGCGFGGTIASLNDRFDRLAVTGLNIDRRQLARARRMVVPARRNNIGFVEADACALPFSDQSFDRVLAVECIFHFPSRDSFFREARRVLRPGGMLVLSDFVPAHVFLPFASLATKRPFSRFNVFGHCDITFTDDRYRKLAAATGFTPIVMRNVNANTMPTYRYLRKIAHDTGGGRIADLLLRWTELHARAHLISYRLLSFRRA